MEHLPRLKEKEMAAFSVVLLPSVVQMPAREKQMVYP
jgi:hypothetical protein